MFFGLGEQSYYRVLYDWTSHIRKDSDIVRQYLLGIFWRVDACRIRKIVVIPVMQGKIFRPLLRFLQSNGNFRQTEQRHSGF